MSHSDTWVRILTTCNFLLSDPLELLERHCLRVFRCNKSLTRENLQARQADMKQNRAPVQPAGSKYSHMGRQPSVFAELADTCLIVGGTKLHVHSAILAANSKVFAEMFSEAKGQQQDFKHQLEVPLPGDVLGDVRTALQYLYKGCTVWLASTLEMSDPWDAVSLAKFAHKYEIEPLLQACEEYLVHTLQFMGSDGKDSICFETGHMIEAMAIFIDLAETCSMRKLLAHCELLMIKAEDGDLWTHPAMLSDAVSKHSLLRMLRAFQAGLNRGGSRVHQPVRACSYSERQRQKNRSAICFNRFSSLGPDVHAQDPGSRGDSTDVSRVATLMSWNKP